MASHQQNPTKTENNRETIDISRKPYVFSKIGDDVQENESPADAKPLSSTHAKIVSPTHAKIASPARAKISSPTNDKTASPTYVESSSPEITPLDGGWGWLLVFSSAMLFLLVHGVTWCMGIFFNPLREYFDSSRAQTSWLNSAVIGIYDFIGVLVSPVVSRYGFRRAAMFGSLLAATAIFVSSFSPNMPTLIFTFGLLGGAGLGFMHIPAVVIVGHYFHKRRSFATGLVCSSGGIGAFIFAPMLNYFISEYGWKGTFWILSGIILNGVLCAYLYKVVELNAAHTQKTLSEEGRNTLAVPLLENGTENDNYQLNACSDFKSNSYTKTDQDFTKNENLDDIHRNRPSAGSAEIGRSNVPEKGLCDSHNFVQSADDTKYCDNKMKQEASKGTHDIVLSFNKDIQKPSGSYGMCVDLETGDRGLKNIQQRNSSGAKTLKSSKSSGMFDTVCRQLGFPLLRSPTFVTYTVSVFLWSAGLFVPPTYLPPLAIDLGIDSTRAALLVSIIGISNTIGRVVFGFISDLPRVDPLFIKTVMVVVGGGLTCLVPHLKTYPLLAAYCVLYGSCIGVYVTLRSPVLVDLVGLHNFTSAFGLLYMAHGFGGFVGSPLAIFLADATGDYKLSFYVIGAIFIMAGLLCAPLRRIARWERLTSPTA